jgi:DNA mismatch repair ATPase MutS
MSSRAKILAKIRQRWGYPRKEIFPFQLISAYAENNDAPVYHRLNSQTCSDIDFQDLFRHVDHSTSLIGQQFLYDKLLKPDGNQDSLKKLDEQARYFTEHPDHREKIQESLFRMNHPNAYYLHLLMKDRLFQRPRWYPLAILDSWLVLLLLLFSIIYPGLLIVLMAPFAVNLMLHLWNKNNTYSFIRSFPQLNGLLALTRKLLAEDIPVDRSGVAESLSRLKGYRRKSRWLSFGQTGGSELAMLFYWLLELLKALFLVEIHSFFGLIRELEQRHADVRRLFCYVGAIDMAISVASIRAGESPTCTPELVSSSVGTVPGPNDLTRHLLVRNLYHPLVKDCVVNSLDINGKGILITGSNMSGKTTLLRSLGINSLLAQTVYTCYAEAYRAPPVRLYSSIRIDDSVLEGKSYYFEEVNVMAELIAAAEAAQPNLYLLDEVFKGTNTVERIATAKAILSRLYRKGHIVVVSTHDLELSDLLKDCYDLYHFEEAVHDGELFFDHLLKPGPLKTRNAIRILGLAGYPPDLIRDAEETSRQLSHP